MPVGGEVGGDIGGVWVYRHWLGEVHLLPAGCRLAGEGGAGQQLAAGGPQVADVGAGVGGRLVEADPGDGAGDVGLELDADLDRGASRPSRSLPGWRWFPRSSTGRSR